MRADRYSVEERSRVMGAVRHYDTPAEVVLRRKLWAEGLRYKTHPRIAGANPDFAFVGPRVAVFVDGCFWHGCPRHYVAPMGNAAYWRDKLRRNRERDVRSTEMLASHGWVVLRVWECEVHGQLSDTVSRILNRVSERKGSIYTWSKR